MSHDFSSSVSLGQKGMLLDNGDVVAWDVDETYSPHHDDILSDVMKDRHYSMARMSFLRHPKTGDTYANLSVDAPVTSDVVGDLLRNFYGLRDNTRLVIEALPGEFEGTLAQWRTLKKRYPAPDPEDYDDGDADTEYHQDIRQWAQDIAEDAHMTNREFLRKGLESSAKGWRERDEEWRGNPRRKHGRRR